jgi:tetratricopeptide (TPR) repeat protein
VSAVLVLLPALLRAQDAPASVQATAIEITAPDADPSLLLSVFPVPHVGEHTLAVMLSTFSRGCQYGRERYDIPIGIEGNRAFHLKPALRISQEREGASRCHEVLAMLYEPDEYAVLTGATSVTLHLPSGAVDLAAEALAFVREAAPPAGRVPEVTGDEQLARLARLSALIREGDPDEALETARQMSLLFARTGGTVGFTYFASFGMALRVNDDLEGAATCYQVALMMAAAAKDDRHDVGVVLDNLSIVRRLQERWPDAEIASDRAIANFERTAPGSLSHGTALNNRAMLMMARGEPAAALAASDRALAVLRQVFKDNPEALRPFLDDNRVIRERLRR